MSIPRWIRWLAVTLGGVAGLLLAAAIALPLLVDAGRYRPLIASKVREATGRSVTLGTMRISLLPSPRLTVRPLSLSESPRYPDRDALRADSLTIRLGLLGLLRGRPTLSAIVLDRPTLTLIRDGRGRWNFDDLLSRSTAAGAVEASKSSAAPGGGPGVAIDRALIRSGRLLIYDDAVVPGERSQVVIDPVDAAMTGWGGTGETRLDLSLGLGGSSLRASARLASGGDGPGLEAQARADSVRAGDLVTLLPWLGVTRPTGLNLGGTLDLDGAASLPVEHPESIRFKGTLRLRELSYRDASMTRPLEDLSGTLKVDGDRAAWEDFNVKLGTSSLAGTLRVEDFLKPRIGFTLKAPRIDFNEILAAFLPAAPPAPTGRTSDRGSGGQGGLLDQIRAHGTLSVEAARFQTFDFTGLHASVGLARSALNLEDLRATFYGGSVTGTARADLSLPDPRFGVGVRVDRIDVNPLLTAYDPGLKDLLGGRLRGNLDVEATGRDMDPILGSARGTADLEVAQGRIASFSVLKQVASLVELAGGKGIGRDETPFDYLRAHLALADRKARTDDLELHSADLDLSGRGWIGLDARLDLAVTARFSKESTEGMVARNARLGSLADREGRLALHFTLSGDLAAPKFGLDARAQAGEIKERARESVKEKIRSRLLDRLRQGPEQGEGKPP